MLKRSLSIPIYLVFFLMLARAVYAQLTINVIGVNASDKEAKEITVRYELPEELEPEHVLDTGGMDLKYDVDHAKYYVSQKTMFSPKETKTFKIRVKDVWRIEPEEIEEIKTQLNRNLDMVKNHESFPAAREAVDFMTGQLDYILSQQDKYSENIERRIEEYRAYRQTMEQILDNTYSLDFLKFESRAIKEMKDARGTVKFVIQVQNPHDDPRNIVHKHYLPEEIREENIVDKKDFEVRYDEAVKKAYLSKEEKFEANELKKYEIIIRDIWQFPMVKMDDLIDRTLIAMEELQETIYQESADRLYSVIEGLANKIRESTASQEGLSVSDHIGQFRLNEKRFEEAKKNFERIEEMIAIVRAKKLQEMDQKKVKNVLQRLKALRGLSALAEALFKKSISITVTWRIIMGSIIFVAFFTTIHFFIWSKRSGKLGEELAAPAGEGIKTVPKPGEKESAEGEEMA